MASKPKDHLREDGRVRHIVVIDDDEELLNLIQQLLETQGYTVATMTNGVQALKHVMGRDSDAILCDFLMPKMDGATFYKALERVNEKLCKHFILMTGQRNDPRVVEFVREKNPVILYKPVTLGKLLGTLRLAFQSKALR